MIYFAVNYWIVCFERLRVFTLTLVITLPRDQAGIAEFFASEIGHLKEFSLMEYGSKDGFASVQIGQWFPNATIISLSDSRESLIR